MGTPSLQEIHQVPAQFRVVHCQYLGGSRGPAMTIS
jgi:hypothetical protein